MTRNINSLLRKKKWTGEEVGKALMASLINDIKHQRDKNYRPLFSQSDFDRMEQSLITEREYSIYALYRDMYNGLLDEYNRSQALFQQFYNGYYRYLLYMKDAQTAENELQKIELLPYVMTEKQLEELTVKAENNLRSLKESFNSILFSVLSYLMEHPKEAPPSVKNALETYKREPVTNKHIIARYNELCGRGYYLLSDGTRSDKVTAKEWKKKTEEDFLHTHKHLVNGKPANYKETYNYYKENRLMTAYELFFNGIDAVRELYEETLGKSLDKEKEEGIMEALCIFLEHGEHNLETAYQERTVPPNEAVNHIRGLLSDGQDYYTWIYYETLPDNFTKYSILKKPGLYDGTGATADSSLQKEFKKDYPALYKALEAYVKELVPQAKDLKATQYKKEFITWGELADLGLEEYINLTTPNRAEIAEAITEENTPQGIIIRKRIFLNGLVIVKNPPKYLLDENGFYNDNQNQLAYLPLVKTLDRLSKENREELQAFKENLIEPAMRVIYAFNALIKILAEVYNMEELKEVEIETSGVETQMNAINQMLYVFYAGVYGTPKEKETKRKLIKELFSPIFYEDLKPSAEAIDKVKEELYSLGHSQEARRKLKNFDALITQLCERGL